MSIALMGKVFDLDIPPLEKLVLVSLADHARDDGTGAYPSVERLTKKTSLSRRGVQKILRRLESDRLIVPTGNFNGGRASTVEYRLTLDAGKGEPGSLFPPAKGRTARPKRANQSARKGEPGSPEPSGTVIELAAAASPLPNPEPENSVWNFLEIHPCGPLAFRSLLETGWARRNGGPYSILIGDALDAWKATEGQNPKGCQPLFQALSKLREHERKNPKPGAAASEGIHMLTPEEIPA